MEYLYFDEKGVMHRVTIHNFDRRDTTRVRVMGNNTLNPSDKDYPDKKWVNINHLFVRAEFTPEFISKNSW